MRIKLTRRWLFIFTARYTLSVGWRCRWSWLPRIKRHGMGCWSAYYLRLGIEYDKHDCDDPWGERKADDRVAVFGWLDEMLKDNG